LAVMQLTLHARIGEAVQSTAVKLWQIEAPDVILNQTPKVEYGELATPLCLGLAKTLKKAPRIIAEELVGALEIEGVRKIEVAGPGYINFYLDRALVLRESAGELETGSFEAFTRHEGKVIVEHTNINPNKAAHIGHLRNAAIGDAFVRILRFTGNEVEVQNYIDNTGVQVADIIVGFLYIENRSVDQVRALIDDPAIKFDYYCWDLYAKASAFYETEDPDHLKRGETLKAIEESGNEIADIAEAVAMTIVGYHLKTMGRINVRYDVLPRESDILHLKFWEQTFTLLKQRQAIFLQDQGKNEGCWVMKVQTESGGEEKVIVRSNRTVTYVGKDIAYQLWKLGLLEQDFKYRVFDRYDNGDRVWVTISEDGEPAHPAFGTGTSVYTVVDVRQSYPQTVVKEGVRALGYEREAERSIHFSYEMVALTPACAGQLGIELSDEDRGRTYVEVSGRKGQGVKADDLLDTLEAKALKEVQKRNSDFTAQEQQDIARQIAVGALRYFLLRFTRTAVIAFDFDEALSFDGETGPYIQYATVRANNILKKAESEGKGFSSEQARALLAGDKVDGYMSDADDLWEVVYTASRIDEVAAQVVENMEPATLAKFAFLLAQKFSLFYHTTRVLAEEDADRRLFYLVVVDFIRNSLTRALDLMGISVPTRM
jgi:arginyl-tRNA synthetase